MLEILEVLIRPVAGILFVIIIMGLFGNWK
jgi:hypothetical protein